MKIWFDLSNSPHINLFRVMIAELQREHEVLITCRPLANTIELLELHGMKHTVVGTHYGRALPKKLLGFPLRVLQLARFLDGRGIDVAVSQSSFHSPVVARLLGVRSLYLNDNEHAMGNIPAFACASQIMLPEFMRTSGLARRCARPGKLLRYPGVKEGVYLWESAQRMAARRLALPAPARRAIYVRPEPWTAQYYAGGRDVLDALLLGLRAHADVTVCPRGAEQGRHYLAPRFHGIRVLDSALDLEELAPRCDLFIGAGGTMTREMAVLGVPTISVYQDALLDVDRYLLTLQAFWHQRTLTAAQALAYLEQRARRPAEHALLRQGRLAYAMIKAAILAPGGAAAATTTATATTATTTTATTATNTATNTAMNTATSTTTNLPPGANA